MRLIILTIAALTGCATVSPAQREAECNYHRNAREYVVYSNGTIREYPQAGLIGGAALEAVCDGY